MEEVIPWDRLADHQILQVGSYETVESLRRRLVELGRRAQHQAPILIRLPNGQMAPTSVTALRTLAQQRGAPILRMRLEALLPELCPEPWAMEGQAEALAAARRCRLPVVVTSEGVPVALALPPPRLVHVATPGREVFDLFDEPLTLTAMGSARFVVATLESTAADVAAALSQEPDPDATFVLFQAGSAFQVVDRRLNEEAADLASQIWPRMLAELRPRLRPAEARPYRELGGRQARAIAERTFLVLLDEQGLVAGLMPPPPRLASQVLPASTDHDLFDLPLTLQEAGLEQAVMPGASFVLATPGTPVARIAADLKKLPGEGARGSCVLVQARNGSYSVVGAWELNNALAGAEPERWSRPLRQLVPRRHPAQVRAVETMGSRQLRLWARGSEPLLLLRQGQPWRLLPGSLQSTGSEGGEVDLFTVPQEVLAPYLPDQESAPELPAAIPSQAVAPAEETAAEGALQAAGPQPRSVNFWFTTPEGQALARHRPLEVGRSYQLHVNLGRQRAESVTATGNPAIREPAPEFVEGRSLQVCLFSDDFDIPQPIRPLLLPPKGDSPIAAFAVTPLRATPVEDDQATIDIAVYDRCNLVQAWQAQVEVVRPGQAARGFEPQRGVLLAARDRDHMLALPGGLGRRHLSLLIDGARDGYHLDLVLSPGVRESDGPEGEVHLSWRTRLRREDVAHLIAKAHRQLTAIARSRPYQAAVMVDEPARRRALQALALVGRQLYLRLFEEPGPATAGRHAASEVAAWLRQDAGEGAVLQVVHRARDFVFPWSLVYDRPLWDRDGQSLEVAAGGFWGYRYEIEVLTEELLQTPSAAGLELGARDRLRVAVGLNDRLAAAQEQRRLFARLAAEGVRRTEYSVVNSGLEWLRLLADGRHELLYLFCHGFTERMPAGLDLPDDLLGEFRAYLGSIPAEKRAELQEQEEALLDVGDSWLKLTYGQMPLTMLQDCAPQKLEAAPLVLLNVCDSAQFLPSLSGGFVPFFLERGARGVIAPDCSMASTLAHAFAREFFPRFLRGQPVGRILWELRRTFLDMGNPLGLAYTLYGDADTRLAVPAP
jgi:hypothetical protein